MCVFYHNYYIYLCVCMLFMSWMYLFALIIYWYGEVNLFLFLRGMPMGILTCVESDKPVMPPFKLRNSKLCSVSSLRVIEYSRLWSDCVYVQAGLSLCWSHIPHCWKSHVGAHIPEGHWPWHLSFIQYFPFRKCSMPIKGSINATELLANWGVSWTVY